MLQEARRKLKLVVPKGKNVIVRDQDTGEIVLIVRRDLCSDAEILANADNTIVFDCSLKRSVRVQYFCSPACPLLTTCAVRRSGQACACRLFRWFSLLACI